ncbi:probable G-protein coupled receptor 156 [Amphiura filiformis]|uniref:probable G-protein coupled receptor 156 n=1 Tax=Amphiura filiformis TaxID=82378 RepID=UPI003B21C659
MATVNTSTPSAILLGLPSKSPAMTSSSSPLDTTGDEDPMVWDKSVHTVSPILFGAMCSLAFCGLLLVGTFLIFNLVYRNHRLIKMSSPNLNILILVGTALMYTCVVLYGLDSAVSSLDELSVICQIRVCILPISFTLVYGSIFTKSWRVYRIFSQAGAKRMVIRDNRLVGMVLTMLSIDCVLLIVWLAVDSPTCYITKIEYLFEVSSPKSPEDGDKKTIVCSSNYQDVWLLTMFAYKAVMLVSVTYLSWATRNVTLISMNDAKCIIISVYTCVIMTSLVSAMSALLWKWPNAWYASISMVILICTTEVLLLHYVPKMREWRNNPDADIARNLTTSYLATSHHSSYIQVEEELFILSAENAILKKALTEKDETIRMLQEHVGSATEKLRQLAMEADNKDSGCDLDELEESSASGQVEADDIEKEENGSPAKTPTKENKAEIDHKYHEAISKDDNHLIATPKKSVCRHTKSTGNIQRQRSRKSKDRHSLKRLSVSSDTSFKQFEELRESIAKELNQVHNISLNLRDEIAQDLYSCRSRPMYFDIADSEREIAEIMKESYNLPDDDEVESVASSAFTYDNPVFSRDQRGRHSGGSGRMSVYTTRSSRQSSFRSVASLSSEYGLGRRRDRPVTKHSSLKMKWPLYIPPPSRENQPREGEQPKIVSNSKSKVSKKTSDGKVLHGTYV